MARSTMGGDSPAWRNDDHSLATLLNLLPGMAYQRRNDANWTMEVVSAGCQALTGYPPEELIGNRSIAYGDLIHPDDRLEVEREVETALASGRTYRLLYRLRPAGGEPRWVWEQGQATFAPDGSVLALQGFIIDVTQTEGTDEALRESERRYRRLLQSVTDYICTVVVDDGRAKETIHGPGCVAVTGYTSEDYARNPYLWYQMVYPEDRPAVEAHAQRALHGDTTPLEHRINHRDGTVRWVRNTPVPHYDSAGKVSVYDALIADITERKLAEVALRDSERFLANVFTSIQDGISILDRDLRIVRVNPAMEKWYAHAAPLVGRHCWQAYHGRSLPCEVCPSRRALDTFRAARDTVPLRGPSGQITGWLDLFSFPLSDPGSGELIGVIEYVRDITEQRRTEEALRASEEHLRQSQKMEAIGKLAGGVAHDFNNLLTAILAYSELLLNELPPDDILRSRVAEIHKAGQRAATLTRQLLAFSRRQILSPLILNLGTVVADMREMLCRLIGEHIELIANDAPDLGSVRADRGQIEQVILNLAVNARDAMPHGGKLLVETKNVVLDETYVQWHVGATPGPFVMLAVSDTGCGMDAETQTHLFEPFFTTKEQGQGTGLGLSTVYGIVKQSGGSIWVYSAVGHGTTVKIYLPRVDEQATHDEAAAAETADDGTETILLVEDDDIIRQLTEHVLATHGYQILAARQGSEALEIAARYPDRIDLLLTDVLMPGMDGRELALRLVERRPETKVLYMSGYTDDVIAQRGVLAPGMVFLAKPFTADDLRRRVRDALEAPLATD